MKRFLDRHLPILKYGTQLPPPVDIRSVPPNPLALPTLLAQRVSVVDFDIPFYTASQNHTSCRCPSASYS